MAAASIAVGLLGFALVTSGLGDGPRLTLVISLVPAGAAVLAVWWRSPLFASVAGIAGLLVLGQAGLNATRTLLSTLPGDEPALWPVLQNTLLPGLVLVGTTFILQRRLGMAAIRKADRRWLALVGAASAAGREGAPASLVVAVVASGCLLLGAFVAVLRWLVFGDAYAPLSAPADVGLACALTLSGAVAAIRLGRATSLPGFAVVASNLAKVAVPILAGALILNPFVSDMPVGTMPGLNLLVLAYLLPAVLAWRLAREAARAEAGTLDERVRALAGGMAIAGLLAYATFATSQVFQGDYLSLDRVTEAELWTHTIVWLGLGGAIMGYGMWAQARVARLTAIAVVAAVAVKVVFVDLAHLTGVARGLSVIALGAVLLGIGMVYQRLAVRDVRA